MKRSQPPSSSHCRWSKQRLKLAAVAPALLELYAEVKMTLEQLMALTVNPDHERQVQVWDTIRSTWTKEPY